jgi:DNA-binding NtrC family response regulator
MANVVLAGLEGASGKELRAALMPEGHQVEHRSVDAPLNDFLRADVVFSSGESHRYVALLRRVRQARPGLAFIVVTRAPETSAWLDALEAGATDYCSAPFEPGQITRLMALALPQIPMQRSDRLQSNPAGL